MSSALVQAPQEEQREEDLPFAARMINHILTPGSSLTSSVWTAFNVIMIWLFACWLLFVFSFPDNIHVWAFGVLGLGLLVTTNWFMSEIFKAGLDYDSQKKQKGAAITGGANKKNKKVAAIAGPAEEVSPKKAATTATPAKKPAAAAPASAAKPSVDKKKKK